MAIRDIHNAFEQFQKNAATIRNVTGSNEDTTRLRAIDIVLFDVLGWDRNQVETEQYVREAGYADYAFIQRQSVCMILEAKRSGITFILPARKYSEKPVGFALIAQECSEAFRALSQACVYASLQGSRYVAISNGIQWLLALTYVPNQPLKERSVYVFESVDAIMERFDSFFHCFSPPAVLTNIPSARLAARILGKDNNICGVPKSQSAQSHRV